MTNETLTHKHKSTQVTHSKQTSNKQQAEMLELTAGWTDGQGVESNTQKEKLTLQTKSTQTHKCTQVTLTLTHTSVVPS